MKNGVDSARLVQEHGEAAALPGDLVIERLDGGVVLVPRLCAALERSNRTLQFGVIAASVEELIQDPSAMSLAQAIPTLSFHRKPSFYCSVKQPL